MNELMSVTEAAAYLCCSAALVRKLLSRRRLTKVKIGRLTRIRRQDLAALVAKGVLPAL